MRSPAKALIVLVSALLLAGCGAPSALPEFEAEQTEVDLIPDVEEKGDIDPASTRYAGDVDGTRVYLARGTSEDEQLCVIVMRDEDWMQTGCAAGTGVGTELEDGTRVEAGSFRYSDSEVGDRERIELSESVRVIASSGPDASAGLPASSTPEPTSTETAETAEPDA
ncbi:hypothetical protein QWJ90_12650 [Microbacterium oryzae]|uniref:hypothetical protein n=1 Tax=Microbacterium oryzae TaxID=743009 RepID=UPI0025B06C3A|nr:hypothetical protein [Microbacterium oryzae]MDN3311779.1 hypothetical protein [Microbacterium oryzae]